VIFLLCTFSSHKYLSAEIKHLITVTDLMNSIYVYDKHAKAPLCPIPQNV